MRLLSLDAGRAEACASAISPQLSSQTNRGVVYMITDYRPQRPIVS